MPSDKTYHQRPTYFLAPPHACLPHSPICLGAIIPSPSLPDEPLYIPPSLPASILPSTYTQTNWSGTHIQKSSAHMGVWTSFLQHIVGIGADASYASASTLHQRWDVDQMHTLGFVPTRAFLHECVSSEEVAEYLSANAFREKNGENEEEGWEEVEVERLGEELGGEGFELEVREVGEGSDVEEGCVCVLPEVVM
ncbi:uncharacterized protein EI97DRAFT_80506 [Westerdykella ornata]|uniref:Uncharacterized protein n=1 Tax=Westerdykella ornata TaxID=318751 RepID=A0A6A6JFU4_WESOR|nr:uncharacterized protein EI97DRAFT_80506 [Westerdykella ornata]KAF2275197.1 hypothetical protein EI97DRAFT_80506 [Westerdykella ornata]